MGAVVRLAGNATPLGCGGTEHDAKHGKRKTSSCRLFETDWYRWVQVHRCRVKAARTRLRYPWRAAVCRLQRLRRWRSASPHCNRS